MVEIDLRCQCPTCQFLFSERLNRLEESAEKKRQNELLLLMLENVDGNDARRLRQRLQNEIDAANSFGVVISSR